MKKSSLLTHWGPFVVTGDGQQLIEVKTHPADPDPSPLGRSLYQSQQCRVDRPSVRQSWLRSGPGSRTELRGEEPFVEVEWDEVLDRTAGELTRVRDDFGHASIYAGSYGWGSAGRFHMPSSQLYRFFRQFGGCTDSWSTYSASAADGILPYIFGLTYHMVMGRCSSWSDVVENTELFVSFGGLRLSNTQVSYNGQGPHRTRDWMRLAVGQGVQFLNVSPIRDDIEDEFSPRLLHPIPGTDVALMAALIHTLVIEQRHDVGFLHSHCVGWPQLEAYILGSDDGTAKSAEWASQITGISAQTIVELAREMATKRTLINVTFAVQRLDHGEQVYWMAVSLAAALGQIGVPGGGFSMPFGSAGSPGGGQPPKRVSGLPVPKRPEGCPTISVSRVSELLEAEAGERYEFNGKSYEYPDTRLVYWCGGNVYHHHQDLNRLNKAWQRPETIIVHEPFWTPMAKRADIVLPATTPLERRDLGHAETLLLAMQPVLDPYGEARDDYEIFCGLARRLGFGDEFSEGRSADEWVEHLYEKFRSQNDGAPGYEAFCEAGTLEHDMPNMGVPRQVFLESFRNDPVGSALSTPSGKIELYSEKLASYGYDDCLGHPAWFEPYERLGTASTHQHQLHLISNQPKGKLHGQYDHGEASLAQKVEGREVCRLHPDDAKARDISEGDVVRLFNARGACLAVAQYTDAVMPSVVQLSTGAWYDPDESGLCKHGNPNVLTRDKGTSSIAQGPTSHTCLVEVERYVGNLAPVTAFEKPAFAPR